MESRGDRVGENVVDGQLPLCSVVIPNHNYARFLPQCLASLLTQGVPRKRLEVIVVDDASTDGSAALARTLLGGLELASWQVLELARVGRPGPVRNAGLAVARGEYLLCLDPDDLLLPGFLAESFAVLGTRDADVAYCGIVFEEQGPRGTTRRKVLPPEFQPRLLANQNFLPSACLMRRSMWDCGVRYRSQTAYEDWDYWVQLAARGARFARVNQPLLLYRLRADGFSAQARLVDGEAKARIVEANAAFYPPWTRAWARGLLRGETWARPFGRGLIPLRRELVGLPERYGKQHGQHLGQRSIEIGPWTAAANLPTLGDGAPVLAAGDERRNEVA